MINKENSSFYLRYLSKITDTNPISYDQIPQLYRDYFSVPVLSQTLNISIKCPHVRWTKVENYFINNKFNSFESLAEGISNEFQRSIDKLYAVYYFTTHHIKYDQSRSLQNDRDDIAAETLFQIQKGVCDDFCNFFIQLAKQSKITSKKMKIIKFINVSKTNNILGFDLPKTPNFDHGCVFIEYKGQEFICDPTWGSKSIEKNGEYKFTYIKSCFLIPISQAILTYYPKDMSFSSFKYSLTYEQFISLNKPNFKKELSIESTPFQIIHVNNGQYELYFSFIQPCDEISSELSIFKDKKWNSIDVNCVLFTCVDNEVPNHMFSMFPEMKRCRYKMNVSFPNKGLWRLEVFIDSDFLFSVYFNVLKKSEKKREVICNTKDENGFIPIEPIEELSTINNGMALIRFVIKLKKSNIYASMYEINKGTFNRTTGNEIKNVARYVTLNLPFKYSSEKDKLVEDWVWIKFPKNGRWEVKIYFQKDEFINEFTYGLTYYFDVKGTTLQNKIPIHYIPCTRTFAPFIYKCESLYFRVEPSSSTIIIDDDYDFYFTVFSDRNLSIQLSQTDCINEKSILPILAREKNTNIKNVKERKYLVSVPRYGSYELNFFCDHKYIGCQNYFIINERLSKESLKERNLMINLKNQINNTNSYDSDIDESIKTNVKEMLSLQKLNTINNTDQTKNENEEDPPIIIKKTRRRIENDAELSTILDENNKLHNKIKILEQEKEMLNSLLKDKENNEKQMKKEIDEKIKQYEERENMIKIESEQKISELTLKIKNMEKLFKTNPNLLIETQNNVDSNNDTNLTSLKKTSTFPLDENISTRSESINKEQETNHVNKSVEINDQKEHHNQTNPSDQNQNKSRHRRERKEINEKNESLCDENNEIITKSTIRRRRHNKTQLIESNNNFDQNLDINTNERKQSNLSNEATNITPCSKEINKIQQNSENNQNNEEICNKNINELTSKV